MREVECKLLER